MKSADQMLREANGVLEMTAAEEAPLPLEIVAGAERKRYALRRASTEDLVNARKRYDALAADDGSAVDLAALSGLLSIFMERADAGRLLKEQGPATVHRVLRALTERAAREIAKE